MPLSEQSLQKAVDEQLFKETRRARLFKKVSRNTDDGTTFELARKSKQGKKTRNACCPRIWQCLLTLASMVILIVGFHSRYDALSLVGRVTGVASALAWQTVQQMSLISLGGGSTKIRDEVAEVVASHQMAKSQADTLGNRLDELEKAQEQMDANLRAEAENRIQMAPNINWFEFYNWDARAIPSVSSPSFHRPRGLVKLPWSPLRIFSKAEEIEKREMELTYHPDGPNAALVDNREVGVSPYCGPPRRGKLQLGVKTSRPIIPLELTIEHFPDTRRMEKRNVKATGLGPKEIELWVQVSEEWKQEAIISGIRAFHPDIMTAQSRQDGRFLDKAQELDSTWVPIGRWEYDVRTTNLEQSFRPPITVDHLNVAIDKFVIRVNSNWGDLAHTCLYRVRMRGIDESETFE